MKTRTFILVFVALIVIVMMLPACSKTYESDGIGIKWVYANQKNLVENQWVQHNNEYSVSGTTRNVHSYRVKTGTTCHRRDSKTGTCTFSTDNYDDRYDYERWEPVVIEKCRVDKWFEYPNEKLIDSVGCVAREAQWVDVWKEYRLNIPIKDRFCSAVVTKSVYENARGGVKVVYYGKCDVEKVTLPKVAKND